MSEFNLEELKTILDAFEWIKNGPSWRSEEGWDDKLQHKLQGMIDTYCEHVHDETMYLSYPPQCKCKKCGEFYR